MATNSVSPKKGKVVDIPDATITIGTPTAGAGQASVAFTVATTPATGGPVQKYTAVSNPGSVTVSGSASPIVVTGLTNGTAYTFQVAAANATGRGPLSSASASVTPADLASYESIATVNVGAGGSGTITFSSIPSTYKHLQIRLIARTDRSGSPSANTLWRFNSDTATNYSEHGFTGNGTTASAFSGVSTDKIGFDRIAGASAGANMFGAIVVDILDYANTNKYKTARGLGGLEINTSSSEIYFQSGSWRSTSAINRIDIQSVAGTVNFVQYSQFALYGIKG
jgi:hypothetical protein